MIIIESLEGEQLTLTGKKTVKDEELEGRENCLGEGFHSGVAWAAPTTLSREVPTKLSVLA